MTSITTQQVREYAERVAVKPHAFELPVCPALNFETNLANLYGVSWSVANAAVERAVADGALQYMTHGGDRRLQLAPYWG